MKPIQPAPRQSPPAAGAEPAAHNPPRGSPAPYKMPVQDRFAAYNRLRRRKGQEPVTMDEYLAAHLGKNGVPKRMAPAGKGCCFPMWAHGERPNGLYCGRVKRPESSYCAEHHALTRQAGTSFYEVERRRGERRKAMVFG